VLTVVSKSFAPQVSGTSILLANLLSGYPGKLNAIAGYNLYGKSDPSFLPPCPTKELALPRILAGLYDRLRIKSPATTCRALRPSVRRVLRKVATSVVFAAYPRDDYFVATFLAARDLGLPFYAHMHDLWVENMTPGTPLARFAEKWEPIIIREARRVLCMTEAMQKYYGKKYGIQTDLLPHTIREEDSLSVPSEICRPATSTATVLFVGAVSPPMNLDALKVLAAASELLPSGYELLFCTSMDLQSLKQQGIQSSRLRAQYVSRAEVKRLQSGAHVLIAPLSHKNGSIEEVRTVFSTKLCEYLVSGRPIIVFAPADSYHAESASRNCWAYVVTEDSPAALAEAIVRVVTNEGLAGRLVRGALAEARSRSARRHAERLHEWVLEDTRTAWSREGQRSGKQLVAS
jgi:glycosyltransferase involved in cell wall biosynthesis